jgi:hypothetical protein|tara:strand:+ start:69 stop:473 length:405 start_codon:yes stop_codon:yes gene_type:complete
MATWDVSKWDEGVWDADPSHARAAGGGAKRRRPNEKIVWYDDWLKSQQKNDVPEEEQIEDIEEAIEVVKAYKEKVVSTVDAKAAILKAKNAEDMLNQVRELKILMETYFAIQQEKLRVKKQDDDFVSMFMLGVL